MTPSELRQFLDRLVGNRLFLSTMIWGPPGIGKSSIVAQVAESAGMELVDVRLSQLAPTDLRGLPVPEDGRAKWFPPEFLPSGGRGILFLDELNMAPPAVQGIAQQLILDRKVGSYTVPEGWFIWAAGNRKEDRAAVFEMPAPLANRFLHLFVGPDFDSWKAHALTQGMHEQVIAFLNFRPSLLHKQDPSHPAWPSPRSWEMASRLHEVGLDVTPVVGEGASAEFEAYRALYENLPDLVAITEGRGGNIRFPSEPSIRYATVIGLTVRADTIDKSIAAFHWLLDRAPAEWVQVFFQDLAHIWQTKYYAQNGEFRRRLNADERIMKEFMEKIYTPLLGGNP